MKIDIDSIHKAIQNFKKMNDGLESTQVRLSKAALSSIWSDVNKDPRFKGIVFVMHTGLETQCIIEHPYIPVIVEFKP